MLVRPSSWLTGYIPDLPTPFNTAGEAPTLTPAERELLIRTAVDVARGRVRIIAGAGSNATSHAIELTRRAEAAGADAALSVVPCYNKPMREGMLAHSRQLRLAPPCPSSA